jgi:hypothetical protein
MIGVSMFNSLSLYLLGGAAIVIAGLALFSWVLLAKLDAKEHELANALVANESLVQSLALTKAETEKANQTAKLLLDTKNKALVELGRLKERVAKEGSNEEVGPGIKEVLKSRVSKP